jgi:hypothetical protein
MPEPLVLPRRDLGSPSFQPSPLVGRIQDGARDAAGREPVWRDGGRTTAQAACGVAALAAPSIQCADVFGSAECVRFIGARLVRSWMDIARLDLP